LKLKNKKQNKMIRKINKWFELNLGWFFVNGRKQEDWAKYLKNKYGNDESKTQKIVLVKHPPKCLVCECDMETLKMNHPFCDECLVVLKKIINKKKKKITV